MPKKSLDDASLLPSQSPSCWLPLAIATFVTLGSYVLALSLAPILIAGVEISGWPTRLIVATILALGMLGVLSVAGFWGVQAAVKQLQQDSDRTIEDRASPQGSSFWMSLILTFLTLGTFALVLGVCDRLGLHVQISTGRALLLTAGLIWLTSGFVNAFLTPASAWLYYSGWRSLVYFVIQLVFLSLVPAALWLTSWLFPKIVAIDSFSSLLLGVFMIYLLRAQFLLREDLLRNPTRLVDLGDRATWASWVAIIWILFIPLGFFPGICALAAYWVDGFTIAGYLSALGVALVVGLAGFPEYHWAKYIKNELKHARTRESIY